MNLEKLISECLRNDRAAQKQLYQLFVDDLMLVARRYGKDISESKDIVQNAFIRIFQNLSSYNQQKGTFINWAKQITVRESIAVLRKNKKWMTYDEAPCEYQFNEVNEAIEALELGDVTNVINKLPVQSKAILLMHYYDELSYKEMAELLQLKESSCRSKVTRARQQFIKFWGLINAI